MNSRFCKTLRNLVSPNGHSDTGMTVKCRAYDSLHERTCLSEEMSKFLWRLVAFACDPRSPKFMQSPPIESYRGWWTIPYFSCKTRRWLISYSVNVKSPDVRPGLVYIFALNRFRENLLNLRFGKICLIYSLVVNYF